MILAYPQKSSFTIAHELAHIKNNDHLIKAATTPVIIMSIATVYRKIVDYAAMKMSPNHPWLFYIRVSCVR